MSFADTIKADVPESDTVADETSERLSVRTQLRIIKSAFAISRGGLRWAIVFVFATSTLRAILAVGYDWHWKYLTDAMVEFASPDRQALWTYIGWWVLFYFGICWVHDHLLTEAHDEAKEWWLLDAQASMSAHAVKGLAVSDSETVEHLAPHILASREKMATMLGTIGSDAPKYITGVLIWGFIVWKAFTVFWFGLVASIGLLILARNALKNGDAVSTYFKRKQRANVCLQQEERKVLQERDRLKDEDEHGLRFLFRDVIYSGTANDLEALKRPWKRFRLATLAANVRLMRHNRILGMQFDLTKVVAVIALVAYCYYGMISPGTVVFLVMLLPKAAEPVNMYQNLQKLMLEARFFVDWYDQTIDRGPLSLREEWESLKRETVEFTAALRQRLLSRM
ncbi:hypothetical protein FJY94_00460 [Candidatus Kaiserbacteria bacterium]|nr:hypothetical protein [Candidatus Kaiserbacteria bacterium]